MNAPAAASKPAEKGKAAAPLLLLLKTSEVVAAPSELPEAEPALAAPAFVLFIQTRFYVRGSVSRKGPDRVRTQQ